MDAKKSATIALTALLGVKTSPDWEGKSYANHRQMSAKLPWSRSIGRYFPEEGLIQIREWGPWNKPGVPLSAGQEKCYWFAVRREKIFVCGEWVPLKKWRKTLGKKFGLACCIAREYR